MGLSTNGKPITPWPGSWAATINQPKHRSPMQLTAEQEDSLLQVIRPLCPNQNPEQLREMIRNAAQQIPNDLDVSKMEQELLNRFPTLKDLIKTR